MLSISTQFDQELPSVFSFSSRSRDIQYDKQLFFLLKSAFIARHETRNFKLPWDIFGDYVNVTIGAAANIKISDAGHANFMPGMSPDMQGMPNPNGFTIGMPSMPNWMRKNWEWIISPARDLGPKFS